MKKILIFISLVLLLNFVAKADLTDSLYVSTGAKRIDILNKLSEQNALSSPKLALNYANEALLLSKNSSDTMSIAQSLFNLGNAYYFAGFYPESKNAFLKAKDYYKLVSQLNKSALSSVQAADKAMIMNEYEQANLLFEEAIQIFKNEKEIVQTVNTLIEYSKSLRATKNPKTLEILEEAMQLQENRMRNNYIKPMIIYEKGNYFFEIEDYSNAKKHYDEARKLFDKAKDKLKSAECLMSIGTIYHKTKELKLAKEFFIQALEVFEKQKDREGQRIAYDNLYKIEYENNNLSQAIIYLEKYTEILKEYYSSNIYKTVLQSKLDRETKSREAYEIQSRQQAFEKQRIQLAKKAKELEQVANRSKMVSLIVVLLMLVTIAYFIYRQNTLKKINNSNFEVKNSELKELNLQLETLKKELDTKNSKINNGIMFAKHIQKSILPKKHNFDSFFEDYFILHKAKSQISSDFYWFYHSENEVIILLGDSRIHGFTAAFTTIMSSIFNNQVIIENQEKSPAQILTKLNNIFADFEMQENNSLKNNHLEISIISINKKENLLKFASAKRPLYFFDNEKLIEIKGDKHFIGEKSDKNVIFKEIEIRMQKGMEFYLTTNGFTSLIDDNNTKYGSKKFKILLEKIYMEKMDKQMQVLENEIVSFKGNQSQKDDITIFGFRV